MVKKPSINFVKPQSPDTIESLSKKLTTNQVITPVTDKTTLTIPPQGVYKLLKDFKISNRDYKVGEYVKFI